MADLFDNPMGLNGFEFVEFASPEPGVLEPVFEKLGFSEVARTAPRTSRCTARATSTSSSTRAAQPGRLLRRRARPVGLRMAFRVRDSHKAYARALELGAQPVECPPARWNCACRRSRASAARRCT
jgi:4-hydroxyphenylpyruvate dioxygenase